MQKLQEKYNITEVFYKRYFEQNALNRMAMEMLKFMWFREGTFINPMKKDIIFEKYINEEKEAFFEKNILNIPQIEFCITTKCTLKCKDCCALIPQLDKCKRSEMSFDNFKLYLDKLLSSVDSIRHLVILGGEPLINPELPKMLEYAAKQEKIFFIQLITNGTMLPQENLLNIMQKYNNRIYVYMSNYSDNPELKTILKQDEIKTLLKEKNIRLQKPENWPWTKELGVSKEEYSKKDTLIKFMYCNRTKCNTIMNGHIDICSKASAGRELGLFEDDSIDIINSKDLRNELITFYQKEYLNACKYCTITDIQVQPALQL